MHKSLINYKEIVNILISNDFILFLSIFYFLFYLREHLLLHMLCIPKLVTPCVIILKKFVNHVCLFNILVLFLLRISFDSSKIFL
jgi:hypothetical protein